MILSSTSDSKKTKKAIDFILLELDFHLCCEVINTKSHNNSFVIKNWVIDEQDFYVAHLMFKKKKTNWATLMDLVPLLGEVYSHYEFFSNYRTCVTDNMSRLETLHYYWKAGLNYLEREGYRLDKKECYAHMIEQTTEWREQ